MRKTILEDTPSKKEAQLHKNCTCHFKEFRDIPHPW